MRRTEIDNETDTEENEEDKDHNIDIVEDCKDITKNKNSNKIEDIALDDGGIVKLKNDKIREILNVNIRRQTITMIDTILLNTFLCKPSLKTKS